MNGPVHEVQHIPRELHPDVAAALPLTISDPEAVGWPTSQALHLSATPGGWAWVGVGGRGGRWWERPMARAGGEPRGVFRRPGWHWLTFCCCLCICVTPARLRCRPSAGAGGQRHVLAV